MKTKTVNDNGERGGQLGEEGWREGYIVQRISVAFEYNSLA